MNDIRLVIPQIIHEKEVMEFRQEFLDVNEKISGGNAFEQAVNYEDWLKNKYIPFYGDVKELVYLAFNDDMLIGVCDIRLTSNDFILNFAGEIGYSVRPSLRGRSYATKILQSALTEASKQGFKRILVTCNEPNVASAKVIERYGGILENIVPHPGFLNVKRYCIVL